MNKQLHCVSFILFLATEFLHHSVSAIDKVHPELGKLFEGDIILPEGRNAIMLKDYLWPHGVVPYNFHSNYTTEEKAKVEAGMRGIENKTCVKFVPHTKEADYIEFGKVPDLGCGAMVGRRPGRGVPMAVNYQAPECLREPGTIQHELLHVLGLFHEQTRPDRDDYVTVLWDNIQPEFKRNFEKAPQQVVTTYDVPYNYKSLMHYPKNAFSKNGKDTIIAKDDPAMELGQYEGPSDGDLEKIQRLYNCTPHKSSPPQSHGLFSGLFGKSRKP